MIAGYRHVHVTEREVGPWQDCTFAAGLEAIRAWTLRAIPPTVDEKELLRAAAGLVDNHGGANVLDLTAGARRRYGIDLPEPIRTWDGTRDALVPGTVAVVQGLMGALPAHWRRHQASFVGSHAVCVLRPDSGDPVWCDPLAPAGWDGERIGMDLIRRYFVALDGAASLVAPVGALATGGDMALGIDLQRWTVPAGTPFYEGPGGALIGKFGVATTVTSFGFPLDRLVDGTPGRDYSWRAAIVTTAALDKVAAPKLVYIKRDAATAVATSTAWDAFVLAALADPGSFAANPKSKVTVLVDGVTQWEKEV